VTTPPDDYKVGYGRPPLETRWGKGESGNPSKKPRRQENIVEMLDRLLLSPVKVTLNGETKRVSSLEAIISQLQVKEMSGNASASRISAQIPSVRQPACREGIPTHLCR
jgi:hypothetical protein